jgi:hypothetical protein
VAVHGRLLSSAVLAVILAVGDTSGESETQSYGFLPEHRRPHTHDRKGGAQDRRPAIASASAAG